MNIGKCVNGLLGATLLAGAVLVSSAGVATANVGQRPETITVHDTAPDETVVDVVCGGQLASITLSNTRFVFHSTAFADGRIHVTGTFIQDFTWTQNGETFTGHLTGWFGDNVNSKSFNATFTLSGQAKGSQGSKAAVRGLAHVTVNANGETTTEFDSFAVTCR